MGSGKSTLVNQVKNELEKLTKGVIRIVQEPVEKWQETKHEGKSILELSYTKPEKYSMSFQTKALSDMMEGYLKAKEKYDICIFERNPSTTINVFATNLNNKGHLNDLEIEVLKSVEKTFVMTGNITEIDLTIYLETEPQTAHNRVKERNRDEENTVSIEEIEELNKCYKNYMNSHKGKVVIINANRPKEEVLKEAIEAIIKTHKENQKKKK